MPLYLLVIMLLLLLLRLVLFQLLHYHLTSPLSAVGAHLSLGLIAVSSSSTRACTLCKGNRQSQ